MKCIPCPYPHFSKEIAIEINSNNCVDANYNCPYNCVYNYIKNMNEELSFIDLLAKVKEKENLEMSVEIFYDSSCLLHSNEKVDIIWNFSDIEQLTNHLREMI